MKSIDFSKGARGKYAEMDLRVVGDRRENSQKFWAICVTSEEKNLIPLKMYEVETFQKSSDIKVVDETGNQRIYQREYFLFVKLQENEAKLLNDFSLSI